MAKFEVDFCSPKIILPSLMGGGGKNSFFFIHCTHVLFCGACTTELCLSATSDEKESVRRFAVFCIYKHKDSYIKMFQRAWIFLRKHKFFHTTVLSAMVLIVNITKIII